VDTKAVVVVVVVGEVVIIGVLPEEVVVSKAHEGTAGEGAPPRERSDTTASLISRVPTHASTKKG
jgi:cell division protein FtsN